MSYQHVFLFDYNSMYISIYRFAAGQVCAGEVPTLHHGERQCLLAVVVLERVAESRAGRGAALFILAAGGRSATSVTKYEV